MISCINHVDANGHFSRVMRHPKAFALVTFARVLTKVEYDFLRLLYSSEPPRPISPHNFVEINSEVQEYDRELKKLPNPTRLSSRTFMLADSVLSDYILSSSVYLARKQQTIIRVKMLTIMNGTVSVSESLPFATPRASSLVKYISYDESMRTRQVKNVITTKSVYVLNLQIFFAKCTLSSWSFFFRASKKRNNRNDYHLQRLFNVCCSAALIPYGVVSHDDYFH